MVMGAMSVGASMFIPRTSPELQRAASIPLFIDGTSHSEIKKDYTPSEDGDGTFTTQHALVANAFPTTPSDAPGSRKKPTLTTQSQLNIQLGPVKASTGVVVGRLQLKVDASSLVPTVNIEIGSTPSVQPTTPLKPEVPVIPEPQETPTPEPTPVPEPVQSPTDPAPEPTATINLFIADPTTPTSPQETNNSDALLIL